MLHTQDPGEPPSPQQTQACNGNTCTHAYPDTPKSWKRPGPSVLCFNVRGYVCVCQSGLFFFCFFFYNFFAGVLWRGSSQRLARTSSFAVFGQLPAVLRNLCPASKKNHPFPKDLPLLSFGVETSDLAAGGNRVLGERCFFCTGWGTSPAGNWRGKQKKCRRLQKITLNDVILKGFIWFIISKYIFP